MAENRKIPTEKEMIYQLKLGKVSLPPLSIRFLQVQPANSKNIRLDATIQITWNKKSARFAVECRTLSTPKAFSSGLYQLKSSQLPADYYPLLFVPYLDENQLLELERNEISGLDLCGNGVVIVPGLFAFFRTGKKNRFSSSAPIKNIYRQNSSMVGRIFLSEPTYDSVQAIWSRINSANLLVTRFDKTPMSLSTVSKALGTLAEDLIVSRVDQIRLLQPDKLLQKLTQNYAPPKIRIRTQLKVTEDDRTIRDILMKQSLSTGIPLIASGLSSVNQYAVMQRGEMLSIYCPNQEKLLEQIPGSLSDRFPNLEVIETEDETVYFDARRFDDFLWSSPVQVYLELMAGDKRDQETADLVKSYILKRNELSQ